MNYCNICDIVHDLRFCPLCKANNEIGSLEMDIVSLKENLSNIEQKD